MDLFLGLGLLLIWAVWASLLTVVYLLLNRRDRRRRVALAAWASSRGLRFDPSRDRHMKERYPEFNCLDRGILSFACNVMRGRVQGRPVCAFDCRGWGEETPPGISAVIVGVGLRLKLLLIRERQHADNVNAFLGLDGLDAINFESTEFSKEFLVKTPDRRWAFDVIHQETMEFLLASPRFTLELQGRDVIAYREQFFKPEDFDAALDVIAGFLDRLPDYLLKELKGRD